jgi:cytosine/creatinine deaminase
MGRNSDHNVPRGVTRADRFLDAGVTVSLATDNVMNAFTPFGDASLVRIANLFANIAQIGRPQDLEKCWAMIGPKAAQLMNIDGYELKVGNPANFLVVASPAAASAIAEIVLPFAGCKSGRRTFTRANVELHRP